MNTRLYPITEEYFKKHIDCGLVEFKDGRVRSPLIRTMIFFVRFYLSCVQEFHGEMYHNNWVLGIQSTLVLIAGALLDGFGRYYKSFRQRN